MTRSTLNPFPGLRAFRTDEHHLFFGREEQTAALLGLLESHRFLAVVGTSGSGKSSLVRAGLIPALHRGTMARVGTAWEVVLLRPGGNPVASLGAALVEAGLYDGGNPETLPSLQATLGRSRYGLVEAVRQSSELEQGSKLLIVVDQFEELFRFRQRGTESEEAASAFVRLLLAASAEEEGRIYVTITMRSDYLGDCAQIPGLAEAVNRGEYLIPRLTRDQRRDAIEKPVGVGRARIAPRLVLEMLNDVGDDPDQLPVLQHALMRTFDAWATEGAAEKPIDLPHYESTGGMGEALSRHADEVFSALADAGQRAAAERLFKVLTVKGSDNRGIRRPTRIDRLARIVGENPQTIGAIVDAFRAPGVTFLMPGTNRQLGNDTVIDLSHESLMRVWRRLRDWVEEEALSARIYHRLAETAELWKRNEAGLYHNPDLEIAWSWREAAQPNSDWAEQYGGGFEAAIEFLETSRAAAEAASIEREAARQRELDQAKRLAEAEGRRLVVEQRARKRLRVFAAGLALVAGLAVCAFFFALEARRQADSSAALARANETAATTAAEETKRISAQLKETFVSTDFHQAVDRIESSDGATGLAHLAQALRTDPSFWQAGFKALSTLASGRFQLEKHGTIAHEKPITVSFYNAVEELLFTSDRAADNPGAQRFVWDARTGKRLYEIQASAAGLSGLKWTPDGQWLIAVDNGQSTVRSWAARTGVETPPIASPGIQSLDVAQHPSEGVVILGRVGSGALRVWKRTGELLVEKPVRDAALLRSFFMDGARSFGAVYGDGQIVGWDVHGGAQTFEASVQPYRIATVDADPGNVYQDAEGRTILVVAAGGKKARWWNVEEAASPQGKPEDWLSFEMPIRAGFIAEEVGRPAKVLLYVWPNEKRTRLYVDAHDRATRARVAHIEAPATYATTEGSLVAAIMGATLTVWDLDSGVAIFEVHLPEVLSEVVFSPEGRSLATISISNKVMLWDLFTRAPRLPEPIENKGPAGVLFSPDGEKLITFDGERKRIQVWNSRTGERVAEPISIPWNLRDVYFTANDRRWVLDDSMTTDTGEVSKLTERHFRVLEVAAQPSAPEVLIRGSVAALGPVENNTWGKPLYTPEGDAIVCVGKPTPDAPDSVLQFDSSLRKLQNKLELPDGVWAYSEAIHFTPDGRSLLIGCSDNRLRVWNRTSGRLTHSLEVSGSVLVARASPDGKRVATACSDGKVWLWDLESGALLCDPIPQGNERLSSLIFHPDGSLLASGSADFKVRVCDGKTGAPRFEITTDSVVQSLAFSRDGLHLLAVPFSQGVLVIDVAKKTVVRKLLHGDSCRSISMSPDGRLAAVGLGGNFNLRNGGVQLWDWREGTKALRLLETNGAAEYVQFSRDGALLATGTIFKGGGAVQVWDVASGRSLTDPIVEQAEVSGLDFHPDGTSLGASWRNGATRWIDLPPRPTKTADWLPPFLDAVAGRRLAGSSGSQEVPEAELARRRTEIAALGLEEPLARWAKWLVADPETRTISPNSRVTFRDYLADLRLSPRIEDLQRARRLAPTDTLTDARYALAILDLLPAPTKALDPRKEVDAALRKQWQGSASWYSDRAAKLDSRSAEAWLLRAELHQRLGNRSVAEEANSKALDIAEAADSDPVRIGASWIRAELLASEGKWEEADAVAAKCLDGISAAGVPLRDRHVLFGAVADLIPGPGKSGDKEVVLPAPIPGTFEDFNSIAEGGMPAGWRVDHVPTLAPPNIYAKSRFDNAQSTLFEDWISISLNRVLWRAGNPYNSDRIFVNAPRDRQDGAFAPFLLTGRFLFSLSDDSGSTHAHFLYTPELDCTGKADVHVAFHSAYEQGNYTMASLEYTIDRGKTWLPVLYRVHEHRAVLGRGGEVDALATLTRDIWKVPLFLDAGGKPRGVHFGDFLGAPPSKELAPFLELEQGRNPVYSQCIEVFRLPRADGQRSVQLRFAHCGRDGYYWAIDDFGLYEVAEPAAAVKPARVIDRTRDPNHLAATAIKTLFGMTPRPGFRLSESELKTILADGDKAKAPVTAANKLDAMAVARKQFDAQLMLRRGRSLGGDQQATLLASALVASRTGAPDEALATARQAISGKLPSRQTWRPLIPVFLAAGDSRSVAGDADAAALYFELAFLISRSTAITLPGVVDRLASVGLVGESNLLLARGSDWKYREYGQGLDAAWKSVDFNDDDWPIGKARLGYGNDNEVTRLSYGPDANKKPITAYFRAELDVPDPTFITQLKIHLQRDDGAIVYLNGEEVVRENMPQGWIEDNTLAAGDAGGDENEQRFFEFTAAASSLRTGRNVVAVEVHQATPTSSDLGFDLEIEGVGQLKPGSKTTAELAAAEERERIPSALRGPLWALRAELAIQKGDLERARQCLEQAESSTPGSLEAACQRAHLTLARGDAEGAFEAYKKTVEQAVALKRGSETDGAPFLPEILRRPIEEMGAIDATTLAAAALLVAQSQASTRNTEARWLLRWSESLEGSQEETLARESRRLRIETLFTLRDQQEALRLAEAALRSFPILPGAAPVEIRQQKELLRMKERCLQALARMDEAQSVKAEVLRPPARDPARSARQIDLTPYYNACLYDDRGWQKDDSFPLLPETFRPRDGIDFDIRGAIELNSGPLDLTGADVNANMHVSFPYEVAGIRVGMTATKLHFLLGATWGGRARKGEELARIVVHYNDGAEEVIPLRNQIDLMEWTLGSNQSMADLNQIAWVGYAQVFRNLTRSSWTNPSPEKPIATLDFVSAKGTGGPILLAVTAGEDK